VVHSVMIEITEGQDMTSTVDTRAEHFRELNRAGRLLLPNAWDAASARVLEQAGFAAVGTTSAGIAYTQGVRDGERITRDAMIAAVATIAGAVSCPVNADVEAGYGGRPADVTATVDAVLDAGASGINLEDNTHGPGHGALFGIDEQCARLAAAREVAERRGVPLVINARTDTFLLSLGADIDERIRLTVARGRHYLRSGADLVFVPLLVSPAVVARLAEALEGRISLMALPGAPPARALFDAGASRVSLGNCAMLAALGALRDIADDVLATGAWTSIERSFYGFAEAELLFRKRTG